MLPLSCRLSVSPCFGWVTLHGFTGFYWPPQTATALVATESTSKGKATNWPTKSPPGRRHTPVTLLINPLSAKPCTLYLYLYLYFACTRTWLCLVCLSAVCLSRLVPQYPKLQQTCYPLGPHNIGMMQNVHDICKSPVARGPQSHLHGLWALPAATRETCPNRSAKSKYTLPIRLTDPNNTNNL